MNGPELSHLLFADNIVLFAKASVEHLQVVMNCFDIFL